jgi:hypothetical protein
VICSNVPSNHEESLLTVKALFCDGVLAQISSRWPCPILLPCSLTATTTRERMFVFTTLNTLVRDAVDKSVILSSTRPPCFRGWGRTEGITEFGFDPTLVMLLCHTHSLRWLYIH